MAATPDGRLNTTTLDTFQHCNNVTFQHYKSQHYNNCTFHHYSGQHYSGQHNNNYTFQHYKSQPKTMTMTQKSTIETHTLQHTKVNHKTTKHSNNTKYRFTRNTNAMIGDYSTTIHSNATQAHSNTQKSAPAQMKRLCKVYKGSIPATQDHYHQNTKHTHTQLCIAINIIHHTVVESTLEEVHTQL